MFHYGSYKACTMMTHLHLILQSIEIFFLNVLKAMVLKESVIAVHYFFKQEARSYLGQRSVCFFPFRGYQHIHIQHNLYILEFVKKIDIIGIFKKKYYYLLLLFILLSKKQEKRLLIISLPQFLKNYIFFFNFANLFQIT